MQVLKDQDDRRDRREPGDQGTNGGERLPLLFLRADLAASLAVTVIRRGLLGQAHQLSERLQQVRVAIRCARASASAARTRVDDWSAATPIQLAIR